MQENKSFIITRKNNEYTISIDIQYTSGFNLNHKTSPTTFYLCYIIYFTSEVIFMSVTYGIL